MTKKFIQQDQHKKPGLKKKWKRSKGLHSKMRLKKRGYRKGVSKGYKTAKKERGLYKGSRVIKINSLKDLKISDKEKIGVIISKNIGLKKKLEILKKIEKGGIKILNIDVKKFLKNAEGLLKERKEGRKKEKVKKGEEKEKTLEKKVEKSEEEIKKEEKREKDKILTKKEG